MQAWIAEARRSRDLLAGSRILAWMMGDLLGALDDAGAHFRLPQLQPTDLTSLRGSLRKAIEAGSTAVSNRASGWLPVGHGVPRSTFEGLEARLEERWRELRREVAAHAGHTASELWQTIQDAVGETECPFHLVWAAEEFQGSDEEGLYRVDLLYTAVQRSRPSRPSHGHRVRKCGQCGRREAMGGPDRRDWRQFQDELADLPEVRRGLRFEARELLCPVCALRRLAGYLGGQAFPSTSAIAARDWPFAVRSVPELRDLLRALEDTARRVPGYEDAWADRAPLLYPASARRELQQAEADGDQDRKKTLEEVLERQQALASAIHHRPTDGEGTSGLPSTPPDYLAVVHFDGDDLGRWLREDLQLHPHLIRNFQQRLADRLGTDETGPFHQAEPFYLGGDEGLVLVPVGSTLPLATAIRELWSESFGDAAAPPTLSMGVAVFHRERPLGPAIETSRSSLEAAKQLPGKDALTVSVQTASGSVWSATGRWRVEWERLGSAVDLIARGRLAAGWPHDVEAFLRTLPPEAFTGGEDMRRALREEVRRLTFRRTVPRREDDRTVEERRREIWEQLGGESWWTEDPPEPLLEEIPLQFHMVAFLARHAGARPPVESATPVEE